MILLDVLENGMYIRSYSRYYFQINGLTISGTQINAFLYPDIVGQKSMWKEQAKIIRDGERYKVSSRPLFIPNKTLYFLYIFGRIGNERNILQFIFDFI